MILSGIILSENKNSNPFEEYEIFILLISWPKLIYKKHEWVNLIKSNRGPSYFRNI